MNVITKELWYAHRRITINDKFLKGKLLKIAGFTHNVRKTSVVC